MTDISTQIRTALISHPATAAHLGDRIALNAVGESVGVPYAVYRVDRQQERGLSGALLGEIVTIEVQVWARSAQQCITIGDAVSDALAYNLGALVTRRVTGFDGGESGSNLDYESIAATYPVSD